MDGSGFDSKIVNFLEHALDLASRRQQLISSNIANAGTPGYRTKDLDFAANLKQAIEDRGTLPLASTHGNHIALEPLTSFLSDPKVIEPEGLSSRNDQNNVSTDREMAKLAENSLEYMLASQLIVREFGLIRTAIREGR